MKQLEIRPDEPQTRLDQYLKEIEEVGSRSQAQKLIKEGRIQVEGVEPVTPKTPLEAGQTVTIQLIEASSDLIEAHADLIIPYEDDDLLVVNKPCGMVVHPSVGHHSDSLANYLLGHCKLSQIDPERPGIVHRLDKDTSGLLVVAKNNFTHQALAKQFQEKTTKRIYQAICWGIPKQPVGKIDAPLGRHPANRKKRAIVAGGKDAVTHWKLLEDLGGLSLIQCRLETGRTHQIRVHMTSIGHSLLGDPLYGRFRDLSRRLGQDLHLMLKQISGQALHAKMLGFHHPKTEAWLEFDSDLPETMSSIIKALKEAKSHES